MDRSFFSFFIHPDGLCRRLKDYLFPSPSLPRSPPAWVQRKKRAKGLCKKFQYHVKSVFSLLVPWK